MPEPINGHDFTGPHPTCREFVAQLTAWGFTQRGQDHVHTVFRGPRGGTLRVIRSQLGRADPALVEKAARLAGVTPGAVLVWAGASRHVRTRCRTPPAPVAPPPAVVSAPPTTASSPSSWPSTPKRTGRSASTRLSSCPGTG